MIYTITANPALDCAIECNQIDLGETNYYQHSYSLIGGKGINVAIVLNRLGSPVLATGFLGNNNKTLFEEDFEKEKLNHEFVYFDGATRINYKIKNLAAHQETELNGLGDVVSNEATESLLNFLRHELKKGDLVIAGGSLPQGVNKSLYLEIGNICQAKEVTYFLDTTKDPLRLGLQSKPYLIKPNLAEIAEVLEQPIKQSYSFVEIEKMVAELRSLGANNVLLSMGGQGSYYFANKGKTYKIGIAKGKVVNSVGAGDSMLAGFAFGYYEKLSVEETLKYAASAGGATAFAPWLGTKKAIEAHLNEISIQQLEGEKWK
ncbi:1-phosphofructokinase [Entomoplasma freundtii]|uniref:1-phosphofructokinase n=1 Tax=Entomoplasma freundtii TaxID=74700 RepID=A0A2K8NV03_9MOLU|nr:1-phosphofructokinase [Entomoplasma freundtii]ATZ16591.1 1-phosphofructokinase [Entomoplasma freundtii]TDY58243.1 1-phosphofructokinase [Entomoplasma freundtii]